MASRRIQGMAVLVFGIPVFLATGCNSNHERPMTSYGVSGVANPGGDSNISSQVPVSEANAGGSGISNTRGTSTTGAKAGAGSPQIGETGDMPATETTDISAAPGTNSTPVTGNDATSAH